MPTYQYACTKCDHRFELVQSFTDPAASECPVCGEAVRKVFSSVGVVFKGSGFYRNDSREAAKSASTTAKSDSGGKSESSTSDSAKSDSSSTKSDSSTPTTSGGDSKPAAAKSTATKSTPAAVSN